MFSPAAPIFILNVRQKTEKKTSVIYTQNGKKSFMITLVHLLQIKESNIEMQKFSLRKINPSILNASNLNNSFIYFLQPN